MGYARFAVKRLIVTSFVLFSFVLFCQTTRANVKSIAQNETPEKEFVSQDSVQLDSSEIYLSSLSVQKIDEADSAVLAASFETEKDESKSSSSTPETEKHLRNSVLSVFLSDEKIETLRSNLIDYGKNHLPREIRSVYNAIVINAFDYSVILLPVVLILFFIANILFVLMVLNRTIQKKNRKERFDKIFRRMYEAVLMAYMFGDIDWDTVLIKLKHKNRKENRRILISVLMNFRANFKGELEHFIPEIYTKLNLHKDSLKLAHSIRDHKKVMGIMELTHLYPEGARGLIDKLINDPNDYVRSEAQTAYVILNQDNPFNFFYRLEQPFSRWTQLSASYLIRLNQLAVPSFAHFLPYNHFGIQNFSLRMITYFQQFENTSEIIKMVESKSERTRFLAYKAINDLRLYDSCELIKKKYEKETDKNKLEILKAFRNIGELDDYLFLEEVLKTGSVSMKIEACRSIYFMSSESRERIINGDKEQIPDIDLLLAHVMDERN